MTLTVDISNYLKDEYLYIYLGSTIIMLIISFIIGRKFKNLRKIFIFLNSIICLIYVIWRFTTIPFSRGILSTIFGIILYLAELFGIVSFFNFQFLFLGKYKKESKTLKDFNGNIPTVDVLICTYNEPIYLLEMTMAAAVNMEYPEGLMKVHICDDGKREELKNLCAKYGINYITRTDNKGAKAGNLNNALNVVTGDLFVVLDADMIPKPNFLLKTIGYFSDEKMAFVQTPQVYYNPDMYQYNVSSNIPNEQDFFMRHIQEARASRNAVLHVGTNAVFRRSYVLEIGGYPTKSITEDMAVGMLLHAKGYKSEFVNEALVYGLAPSTLPELVKQRDRWCRGNLQVLKHYNPLFTKGLTWGQKITYFDGCMYWYSNIQKMIFLLCPLIYMLTKVVILDAEITQLISIYIPFFLGQILGFYILTPKKGRSMRWALHYDMVMLPHLFVSCIKELFNIKTGFNVTSKDTTQHKKIFHFRMVLPHLILLLLTFISWGLAIYEIITGKADLDMYLINFFWSAYNTYGLIYVLRIAWHKPIFRKSERITLKDDFSVRVKTKKGNLYGSMINISGQGMGVMVQKPKSFKLNERVYVYWDNFEMICQVKRIEGNNLSLEYIKNTPEKMCEIMRIFTSHISTTFAYKKD